MPDTRAGPGEPLQVDAGWADLAVRHRARAHKRPAVPRPAAATPLGSTRVRAAARPIAARAANRSAGDSPGATGISRAPGRERRRLSTAVRNIFARALAARPALARTPARPLARSGRVDAVPLSLSLPARPGAARRPGRRGSRAAPRGLPRPARAPWAMLVRLSFLSVPRETRACTRPRRLPARAASFLTLGSVP